MVILIDMDGTIEQLLPAWIDALNKKHGLNVRFDDVKDWDMRKAFPSLTFEEIFEPTEDDDFWCGVIPIDGAPEMVKKLIDDGDDVYIVTSSGYKTIRSKMENVLFRYFPFIDWNHVVITSNKQMIRGDVLVDDGVHNLIDGEYIKILFDAPYNRRIDAPKYGMYRANNWDMVYGFIQKIKRG